MHHFRTVDVQIHKVPCSLNRIMTRASYFLFVIMNIGKSGSLTYWWMSDSPDEGYV